MQVAGPDVGLRCRWRGWLLGEWLAAEPAGRQGAVRPVDSAPSATARPPLQPTQPDSRGRAGIPPRQAPAPASGWRGRDTHREGGAAGVCRGRAQREMQLACVPRMDSRVFRTTPEAPGAAAHAGRWHPAGATRRCRSRRAPAPCVCPCPVPRLVRSQAGVPSRCVTTACQLHGSMLANALSGVLHVCWCCTAAPAYRTT